MTPMTDISCSADLYCSAGHILRFFSFVSDTSRSVEHRAYCILFPFLSDLALSDIFLRFIVIFV